MRRALLVALLAACSSSSPAIESRRAEQAELVVARGSLEERVLLTGALDAADSVELSVPRTDAWQLSIRWIGKDGEKVAEGERLMEFDNSQVAQQLLELEQGVIRAGNELIAQESRDAVEVADKELEVERQRIEVAKAELDAAIPRHLIASRQWQDYQLALERARTAHASAVDALRSAEKAARSEQTVKRIDYEKAVRRYDLAQEQIDALILKAPQAGVLVVADHPWFGRRLQVGDMVRPGFTAVKVSSGATMVVKAALSDVDDGRIAPGMDATCVLDAYPDRPFTGTIGRVSEIAREPDERSTRRFFEVIIELDQTDPEVMRPGMSARVEVHARAEDDAVVAPRAGLVLGGEQPRARIAGGEDRAIEIGFCTAQACTVTAGLEPGERLRRTGEALP